MTLDDVIARATNVLNIDADCFTSGEDLSAAQYLATRVTTSKRLQRVDGSAPTLWLGQCMNVPAEGAPALTRLAGLAPVIYGATVTAGDRLVVDDATSKMVPLDTLVDGHEHELVPHLIRRRIYLTNAEGKPVAGASSFSFDMKLDDGVGSAPETVSWSEMASGLYLIEFTPTIVGAFYLLAITCDDDPSYQVTPAEFQLTSTGAPGKPSSLGVFSPGVAFTDGVADDQGLMFIRPQHF